MKMLVNSTVRITVAVRGSLSLSIRSSRADLDLRFDVHVLHSACQNTWMLQAREILRWTRP